MNAYVKEGDFRCAKGEILNICTVIAERFSIMKLIKWELRITLTI